MANRQKRMLWLTPYGRKELGMATALFLLLAGGLCALTVWLSPLFAVSLVPPVLVWGWAVSFFRDPDRTPPTGEGLFVSAADGRVSDITPLGREGPLGIPSVRIGVFMSVFNVHVNRSPERLRVDRVERNPGVFLDARHVSAPERNESVTVFGTYRWGGREYPIAVRQVAGKVARRIVTDLEPPQELERGERFGMIKFGSRLELHLPESLAAEIRVRVGQIARAGETVLAAAPPSKETA